MQWAEKGHDNRGMEWLELASVTSWQLSQLCPSQLKWQLRWQWRGLASIHTGYGYGFSRVLARAATTLHWMGLCMPGTCTGVSDKMASPMSMSLVPVDGGLR